MIIEMIGYVYGAEDKRVLFKKKKKTKKVWGKFVSFGMVQTVGFNMDTVADPVNTGFDT